MAGICHVRTFILFALIGSIASALQPSGSHRAKRAISVLLQSAVGDGLRVERSAADDGSPAGGDIDGSPGGSDEDGSPAGGDNDGSPAGSDEDGSPEGLGLALY